VEETEKRRSTEEEGASGKPKAKHVPCPLRKKGGRKGARKEEKGEGGQRGSKGLPFVNRLSRRGT